MSAAAFLNSIFAGGDFAGYAVENLYLPTAVIFLFTVMVCQVGTRRLTWAVVIGALKAGMFFAYYAFVFNGTQTWIDDIRYLSGGMALASGQLGIGNAAKLIAVLTAIGGGQHTLYYVVNALALRLFGVGYYAPVAINMCLTSLVALAGSRLAVRYLGRGEKWGILFFLVLSFHQDILAWALVVNAKDILTLLLTITLFDGYFRTLHGHVGRGAVIMVVSALATLFLRFYVPLLFAGAMVLRWFLQRRWTRARTLTILVVLAAAFVLAPKLQVAFRAYVAGMGNPVFGGIRFLVTPVPFRIEPEYSFLLVPSIIRLVGIPFMVYGLVVATRKMSAETQMIVLYLVLAVLLYGSFLELQGPRHRVQFDVFLTYFTLVGLTRLLEGATGKRFSPRVVAVPGTVGTAPPAGRTGRAEALRPR